jgi:ABC-type multidrug transport system fused ATPase/permease subunit
MTQRPRKDRSDFEPEKSADEHLNDAQDPDEAQSPNDGPSNPYDASLRTTFAQHRGRISFTYCLFVVENLLRLAQPFALGWAINDLLEDRWTGLYVLIGQHVLHLIFGLWRQVLDTRVFTAVYADVVTDMIVKQRSAGVEVSRVAARSALSREYVDFFELTLPNAVRVGFSIVGSLIMLAFYDWFVVLMCVLLLAPATWINRWFSRRIRRFNRGLHDELEKEVELIEPGQEAELQSHFQRLADWRIRLSNAEAQNFGMMEIAVLAVIVITLIRTTTLEANAGDVFAVFRYLMLLLMGLDRIPQLIMQLSRVKDIQRRMEESE